MPYIVVNPDNAFDFDPANLALALSAINQHDFVLIADLSELDESFSNSAYVYEVKDLAAAQSVLRHEQLIAYQGDVESLLKPTSALTFFRSPLPKESMPSAYPIVATLFDCLGPEFSEDEENQHLFFILVARILNQPSGLPASLSGREWGLYRQDFTGDAMARLYELVVLYNQVSAIHKLIDLHRLGTLMPHDELLAIASEAEAGGIDGDESALHAYALIKAGSTVMWQVEPSHSCLVIYHAQAEPPEVITIELDVMTKSAELVRSSVDLDDCVSLDVAVRLTDEFDLETGRVFFLDVSVAELEQAFETVMAAEGLPWSLSTYITEYGSDKIPSSRNCHALVFELLKEVMHQREHHPQEQRSQGSEATHG